MWGAGALGRVSSLLIICSLSLSQVIANYPPVGPSWPSYWGQSYASLSFPDDPDNYNYNKAGFNSVKMITSVVVSVFSSATAGVRSESIFFSNFHFKFNTWQSSVPTLSVSCNVKFWWNRTLAHCLWFYLCFYVNTGFFAILSELKCLLPTSLSPVKRRSVPTV